MDCEEKRAISTQLVAQFGASAASLHRTLPDPIRSGGNLQQLLSIGGRAETLGVATNLSHRGGHTRAAAGANLTSGHERIYIRSTPTSLFHWCSYQCRRLGKRAAI